MLYCSLPCYNNTEKHSSVCVEAFCKEQVVQHLKNKKSSKNEQIRANKMLFKQHTGQDSSDEDESGISESRLVDLLDLMTLNEGKQDHPVTEEESVDQVLSKMTDAELESFKLFVRDKLLNSSNEIQESPVIHLWQPWWTQRQAFNPMI